jgi:peptide/nickel transport system substrate-binding protein
MQGAIMPTRLPPADDVLVRRLSRRALLRTALLAAPASVVLAACGAAPAVVPTVSQGSAPADATTAPAAPTVAPTAAAAAATARGVLRASHTLEWNGKEVLAPASPVRMFPTIELLYNRLVRQDEQGRPAPDLAVSWSSDPGAASWTFKLREGVSFHDGKPFTSADVAYTIRHVLDPKLESPGAAVLTIVDLDGLQTPDPQTIVFKLKQPHADFPLLLLHYSCYIIPDGSADTIGQSGIGTGPFKLQSFDPEASTVVVANDAYYEGPPKLERIEIVGIADSPGRTAALLAGQIDFEYVSQESAALVQANPAYTLTSLPAGDWLVMVMRVTDAPFDNPKVRQALKLLVDREAMVKTVLQGYGTVAGDQPVWPGDQYYLEVKRPQDVAQARTLLAEAGLPDGLKLTLHTSDKDQAMLNMSVAYKEMAALGGVEVEVVQNPADSYWNDIWMKVPFCTSSWGERQADQVLNEVFRSGASWNEANWNDAPFDTLLDDARRELDFAKRKAIYQQAQQLLADEGGSIIPLFQNQLLAHRQGVTGMDRRYYNWAEVAVSA